MLGTHNSCTGYPVINWWMKPFNIFSKCQDTTLDKQVEDSVKLFNIQIAKHPDGNWYASHGLMWYCISIQTICEKLKGQYVQLYYDNHFGQELNIEEWDNIVKYVEESGVNIISTWVESIQEWPGWINPKFSRFKTEEKYWTISWAKKEMMKKKLFGIIPRFWYLIPLPKYWAKRMNTDGKYMKDYYEINNAIKYEKI